MMTGPLPDRAPPHVQFPVTAEDWEALADFQLEHSRTLRATVKRTRLMAQVTALIMATLVLLVTRSAFVTIVAVAAGLIAAFMTPRTIRKNMRKQMRAMFDESFPPGSDRMTRLEVRDDGLATRGFRGTSVLAWPAFTDLAESGSHIYLGLGGAAGVVIPKARIGDGDLDAFHRELRRRIAVRPD